MIQVISEERVAHVNIGWAEGVSDDVRRLIRRCVRLYPHLLPTECVELVVSRDLFSQDGPLLFRLEGVEDHPRDWILMISDALYRFPRSRREHRFVLEMLLLYWIDEGVLRMDETDASVGIIDFGEGESFCGAAADEIAAAVAATIVEHHRYHGPPTI